MAEFKLLLVDDEEEFVNALAERLELRRLAPRVAFDGESALRMVRDDPPEVMVLDLKMPGIDGVEVLRRVKRVWPRVQVVILTGHGSERDEETVRRLGAFECLQKPVDIADLVETLRKAYETYRDEVRGA
jgi:DNA-binding response OmpR family regulator